MFFKGKYKLLEFYLNPINNKKISKTKFRKLFKSIIFYTIRDLKRNFNWLFKKKKYLRNLEDKNIVFANTYNNFIALNFLLNTGSNDTQLVCTPGYVSKNIDKAYVINDKWSFENPLKILFLISILFNTKYVTEHFIYILKYYNEVEKWVNILKNNRPKNIFLSNDHHPRSRGLIIAAKKLNIKCIYIQHANIAPHFPKMLNSHAFLYGQFSHEIYKKFAENTKFYLVGIHTADKFAKSIQNKEKTNSIGIAFNTINDISSVQDSINFLINQFPNVNFIIRPHPAEKRKLSFKNHNNLTYSKNESAFEFLMKIDVLVSGVSSILLEAALAKVWPIQFEFNKLPEFRIDGYGFIKHDLVILSNDKEDLLSKISWCLNSDLNKVRDRASYFDASIGTDYEFEVEKKILEILKTEKLI